MNNQEKSKCCGREKRFISDTSQQIWECSGCGRRPFEPQNSSLMKNNQELSKCCGARIGLQHIIFSDRKKEVCSKCCSPFVPSHPEPKEEVLGKCWCEEDIYVPSPSTVRDTINSMQVPNPCCGKCGMAGMHNKVHDCCDIESKSPEKEECKECIRLEHLCKAHLGCATWPGTSKEIGEWEIEFEHLVNNFSTLDFLSYKDSLKSFIRQTLKAHSKDVLKEIGKQIEEDAKEIDRCAKVLQKSLCGYGTVEGDNHTCDCKFAFDYKEQKYKTEFNNIRIGEENGCAEARRIIWNMKRILSIIMR